MIGSSPASRVSVVIFVLAGPDPALLVNSTEIVYLLFSSKLVRVVHTVLFNGYSVGDTGTVETCCVVWNGDPI